MKTIDRYRKAHLAVAEAIDAWRIFPRALVAGYAWVFWTVISWYMNLEPFIPEDVKHLTLTADDAVKLMVQVPTTQHAVLISAVVGVAGLVIGIYTNTGRKWGEGIKKWEEPEDKKEDKKEE